eukprot:scaffold19784_cov57-Phaeocystis_antarctica.AAC.5
MTVWTAGTAASHRWPTLEARAVGGARAAAARAAAVAVAAARAAAAVRAGVADPRLHRYMQATDRALRPSGIGTAPAPTVQAPTWGRVATGGTAATGAAVAATVAATGSGTVAAEGWAVSSLPPTTVGDPGVGAMLAASAGRKASSSRVPTTTRASADA